MLRCAALRGISFVHHLHLHISCTAVQLYRDGDNKPAHTWLVSGNPGHSQQAGSKLHTCLKHMLQRATDLESPACLLSTAINASHAADGGRHFHKACHCSCSVLRHGAWYAALCVRTWPSTVVLVLPICSRHGVQGPKLAAEAASMPQLGPQSSILLPQQLPPAQHNAEYYLYSALVDQPRLRLMPVQ